MVGEVGADHLELRAVARFANEPVRTSDGLHWDPLELYRHALSGLWTAASSSPDGLQSVAVDSWAVDYALMRADRMLGVPFHYRDERTAAGVERIHARVPFADLYARNGLQFLPFNTIYQLAADPLADEAERMLLIPDLLGYWLTGEMVTERTNASTTGLLDVRTGEWDADLMARVGLRPSLFTDLVDPGATIGKVTDEVGEQIGVPGLTVTAVGSHDTASAVVGVPMQTDDAAYISCGTWGLVGLELDAPVLTDEARNANFTNEGGVDGRTRFLTNVMGTWLISETLREWERSGINVSLPDILAAAAGVTTDVPVFDVQDPRFLPPGDMPDPHRRAVRRAGCARAGEQGRADAQHRREPCVRLRVRARHRRATRRPADPDRARRRRRLAQPAAVPGDRRPQRSPRPCRPGRGHRARQRADPGSCARRGLRFAGRPPQSHRAHP